MSHWAFWLGGVWHPLQNAGYQFWSGVESAIQAAVEKLAYGIVAFALWWKHHECHADGCLWKAKNGRTHCKKHRDQEGS